MLPNLSSFRSRLNIYEHIEIPEDGIPSYVDNKALAFDDISAHSITVSYHDKNKGINQVEKLNKMLELHLWMSLNQDLITSL
jgi:hypothetical protein